jgi:hypothetical protein
MATKKYKRDPLSFWGLVFLDKSSNLTSKNRKILLWSHVYGFIGWCLQAYVVGWIFYIIYLAITK